MLHWDLSRLPLSRLLPWSIREKGSLKRCFICETPHTHTTLLRNNVKRCRHFNSLPLNLEPFCSFFLSTKGPGRSISEEVHDDLPVIGNAVLIMKMANLGSRRYLPFVSIFLFSISANCGIIYTFYIRFSLLETLRKIVGEERDFLNFVTLERA